MDIQWSLPYSIKEGFSEKWRREWYIPPNMVGGFFQYWNINKFKLLSEGFGVSKDSTGKWILHETKNNVALFKIFKDEDGTDSKENIFILPSYKIKNEVGLRPWQVGAVNKLVSAINHWGSAIDGSDLGTGKTYSACGVVRELNVPFVIVCPKPVMHQWEKVIKSHFNLSDKCKGIINYEMLIRGRTDSPIASYVLKRHSKRSKFTWKIPSKSIIIWDEAHRLKNWKTKNSKVCIEAYKQGYNQLFISATLASSPLDLRTIGTCSDLFSATNKGYYEWVYKHGVYKGDWGLEFNNDSGVLKKIHKYLFEERGVRLQRDIIPNFPETEIIVDTYNMDDEDTKKIREIYSEMSKELVSLKKRESQTEDSEMAIRIHALQKTELLKVPLMSELIQDSLNNGMSVVVFLNYSNSIDALAKRLNTECIYDGRNEKIRKKYVELFQENKERVLITNISAAREGLNLGDEHGGHPRISILSPTYSVVKLKQALGRVHRENSKTKSIQRLIYIANTQEEDVVNKSGLKLENLTLINNGVITDDDLKI